MQIYSTLFQQAIEIIETEYRLPDCQAEAENYISNLSVTDLFTSGREIVAAFAKGCKLFL